MLYGLFVLLACQLIGEAVRHFFSLSVPGPVIGILLVMIYMASANRFSKPEHDPSSSVELAADGMLRFLGLLFVPAGVGIAQSYDLIFQNGVGILIVLIGSTVLTLVTTVAVFRGVRLLVEKRSR